MSLFSPFAWYLGRKETKSIDAGLRDPVNRTNAKIGMILGIVGTVIMVLLAALLAFVVYALSTDF